MKKIIVITIISTILFFASAVKLVFARTAEYESEFIQKQQIQAYKWASFNEMFNQAKTDFIFSSIYGGVYFEDTILVINVVSQNEDMFRYSYYPGTEYRVNTVNYSLNELEEVKNSVLQKYQCLKINQIYIDVIRNKVVVSTELSFTEFFEQIDVTIDHEMLLVTSQFIEMDYNINYTVNGHPYSILSSQCTVGFAAKDGSGNAGFVTAGHCIELSGASTGTDVYYDGLHAGDVAGGWHFEVGDVDGAFIKLRYPWIGTKWLPSKNLIFGGSYYSVGTFSSFYTVGTLVAFHGTFGANNTTNTAVEYGLIIQDGITISDTNGCILYDNMFSTSIITHSGDSGGPVTITIYIGEGIYETNVIGVLSHSYNSLSYFSKASDILEELSLSAY